MILIHEMRLGARGSRGIRTVTLEFTADKAGRKLLAKVLYTGMQVIADEETVVEMSAIADVLEER